MSEWKNKPLRPSTLTVHEARKLYPLLKEQGAGGKLRGGCEGMRKRLLEALSVRERSLLLVAKLKPRFERTIGTGAFYCQPTGTEWMYFIKDISVHEDFRRLGVGRSIVLQLLEHAAYVAEKVGNGPFLVYTDPHPKQKAAGKFFESLGFQQKGTRYVIEIHRKGTH